jgi:uridine kinase
LDVDADESRARVVDRDEALHDGQAGSLHRTRYGAADDIYLREVDPVSRADLVVDNRDLAAPRVIRG